MMVPTLTNIEKNFPRESARNAAGRGSNPKLRARHMRGPSMTERAISGIGAARTEKSLPFKPIYGESDGRAAGVLRTAGSPDEIEGTQGIG